MTKFLHKYGNVNKINKENLRDVRKSIVRLIMISSNPILLTHRTLKMENFILVMIWQVKYIFSFKRKKILVLQNKMGMDKARSLAKEGKNSVWSYFRNNIEHIEKYYLKDLNAVYIHGG